MDIKQQLAQEKIEWLKSLSKDELRAIVAEGGVIPEVVKYNNKEINIDYFLREHEKGYLIDIAVGGSFVSKSTADFYFEIDE